MEQISRHLKVNANWTKDINKEIITKRIMPAVAYVFDPIGFTDHFMTCPKMMLQKTWKSFV